MGLKMREAFGYVVGFALFIIAIPAVMWLLSGRPFPNPGTGLVRGLIALILIVLGLALAIWSIVHMKVVGQGNPFDPFDHPVAARTSKLLTTGPYALCRNPMAAGTHLYFIGLLVMLWAPWPLLLWALVIVAHTLQIRSEERRLLRDFGEEYEAYRASVPVLLPIGFLLKR